MKHLHNSLESVEAWCAWVRSGTDHLLCLTSFLFSLTAGLDRLIGKLDGEYLANFCSILAITISDLDVYENKTLCKDQLPVLRMLYNCLKFCSHIRF